MNAPIFCKCGHQRTGHTLSCTFCPCKRFQYRDQAQKNLMFLRLYGGGRAPMQPLKPLTHPVPLTWMEQAILTMYNCTIKPYVKEMEDRHEQAQALQSTVEH